MRYGGISTSSFFHRRLHVNFGQYTKAMARKGASGADVDLVECAVIENAIDCVAHESTFLILAWQKQNWQVGTRIAIAR